MAYAIPICLRSDSFKSYSHINARFYSFHRIIKARSPSKISLRRPGRHYANAIGGPTAGQLEPQAEVAEETMQNERNINRSSRNPTLFKMLESAATTFASILVLGLAGYGYHRVSSFLEQEVSVLDYLSRSQGLLKPLRAIALCASMLKKAH